MFLAAAVQLTSSSDANANWEMASTLVTRAARYGAALIATPENTNFLGPHTDKVRTAETTDGPTVSRWRERAAALGVHLLLGSFNERADDARRCYNTTVLIGPSGDILATYRKIHLFDVNVSPDVCFAETDTTLPGHDVVVADTALGKIGLSICYDLRFPELYGALVAGGAELIAVPSAFTLMTGKDHWLPLTRARAIETQCFVLAPGQSGLHDDHGLRQSYGHSVIVDPWGVPVATASDGAGLALAEIDLTRVRRVRAGMPIAQHRRL